MASKGNRPAPTLMSAYYRWGTVEDHATEVVATILDGSGDAAQRLEHERGLMCPPRRYILAPVARTYPLS